MVGPRRTCRIVDAGIRKPLDLKIHVPVESMVEPDQSPGADLDFTAGGEATRKSIWPAIYPELLEQVREHRSTIVFVNNRRGAERLALRLNELAERGDRARPPRLAGARGAHRRRGDAQGRRAAVPGRHLVARARHRHGRRRPRAAGRVAEVGRPRAAAHRPRRALRRRHEQGPHLPQVPRRPARVRGRRQAHARGAHRADRRAAQRARRARPADRRDRRQRASRRRVGVDELFALVTRTHSYAELSRDLLENVLDMLDGRYPSQRVRRAAPAHRVGPRRRDDPRAQGRAPARGDQRRHDPRPRPVLRRAARRPPRRRARRGDGLRGARRARPSCSAPRRGASRRSGATASSSRRRPACPGAVPFWKGDSVGRPKELGREIGAFSRWAVDQPAEVLERDYDLDALAARNLVDYLREQQDATRVVPSDRTIVIERFRDEIGDWRLCVLSPVRRARARRLGAGAVAAHPRGVRPRVRRDLVRRRDHRPPPRRRRAAGRRPRAGRPRRARGRRRRRARRQRAVRRALPRERRARAAHPARLPGQAHAAVAAAPEVAVAARGRASATPSSRSSSRPTASACATCSTCPG